MYLSVLSLESSSNSEEGYHQDVLMAIRKKENCKGESGERVNSGS